MRNVYLAQINNSYGNNAFLPYSVGLLWSFSATSDVVRMNYRLGDILFLREDITSVVDRLESPGILALSCYIWNWSYNTQLASAVKSRYPECIVIMGGPEVPNRSDGFFMEHGFADVLVHGEGEVTFRDLLIELARDNPDLGSVDGISYRDAASNTVKTKTRMRIADLDEIPSPYTTGLFDQLVDSNRNISFNASQETHRGCPYSCTFCDWGSAVMTKVRQFGTDRLMGEMEWFGSNGIDLLYNCDANYGIMKRDIELTMSMIGVKERFGGYPNKFRAAYAKKSNDKIFEIAKMLNDAGMNKGITLSMQSMDATTLDNVKRSNIRIDDFARLISVYRKGGIPTYTEVIIGLPGETLESFIRGLDEIIMAGQHDNINAYMCMLLRNSEMADPSYIEKHGIKHKRVPILSLHGSPMEMHIREMNDIVVSTNTMGYEDWKKANLIAIMVQSLHCLGLTNVLAMDYRARTGGYMGLYLNLYDRFVDTDTVLGQQIRFIRKQLDTVFDDAGDWDLVDGMFGNVSWPLEEYLFLQILKQLDLFYSETKEMFGDMPYIDQLIDFQKALLLKPMDPTSEIRVYDYDILSFYLDALDGNMKRIAIGDTRVEFTHRIDHSDHIGYAREVIWYGRKSGQSKKEPRAV